MNKKDKFTNDNIHDNTMMIYVHNVHRRSQKSKNVVLILINNNCQLAMISPTSCNVVVYN